MLEETLPIFRRQLFHVSALCTYACISLLDHHFLNLLPVHQKHLRCNYIHKVFPFLLPDSQSCTPLSDLIIYDALLSVWCCSYLFTSASASSSQGLGIPFCHAPGCSMTGADWVLINGELRPCPTRGQY